MESEMSLKQKAGNLDVVVEINSPVTGENGEASSVSIEELSRVHMNLFTSTSDPAAKPPSGAAFRRRLSAKSEYSKPKSRIVEEPPYPSSSNPIEENAQPAPAKASERNSPNVASPSVKVTSSSPKASVPVTPRTPLMASVGDDDDDDDEVYKTENVKIDKKKRGKKMKVMILIEWIAFVSIMAVLIASLTVHKLEGWTILGTKLWRWSVLVLVIFCGRLFTEWLTNVLVFLIERNFLLKKKVLYFLFGLKKSVRVVIWLGLILLAWGLLINRGIKRSRKTTKVLNYITRGIASSLIGAVMWMLKTLLIKLLASSFHVRTFFDRIQESIFHQYILQALSGPPSMENAIDNSTLSCQLSLENVKTGKQEKTGEGVINVDKLHKMKRGKVSAWTMGGLIKVIRSSGLPTISEVLDESVEEEDGEQKVITSEVEAKDAANRIFKNVARPGHKYIDEEDLLRFMPKEEVDNAFPLFEVAVEQRRIKKSSFRNWVVKAYNERKCLAASLNDAKTAIEELNKIASGIVLVVIIIVWLLLMEIATTKVLVFISSQMLLVVFMFGNTAKMVFEAIVFVFVVHPFDVGDRCVIDGIQMIVEEMNILTTIFLKPDNEKVYYPNAILATKPISNFNRSPEMMGDAVEFSVDFSTSVESIAALRAKIKAYLESKPKHWHPGHSVQIKEIEDVNKMLMALYVTHTINFQNAWRKGRPKI
ncbi:Mechanosensitive ion channel protein 10 [Abeliophyllum distichum]|uniref:Mechanosensitive ion channel protein n=1 Tax=Abeliophyllum distichum TaxID=126358 RepID=A0ABD1QV10_9LAMI